MAQRNRYATEDEDELGVPIDSLVRIAVDEPLQG